MVKLSKAFYLTAPIVSAVASLGLGVGIFVVMKTDISDAWLYLMVGGIGLLYASIVALIFCYKMWESIQDGHARMSPGKAVGFLFIPLFNLYWMFHVFWGFAKDYNAYIERNGVNVKKLREELFLAFSILPLTTWIPFLNFVTTIAYWVVFCMVVSQVCDAVNTLPAREGASETLTDPPLTVAGPLPLKSAGPVPNVRGIEARLGTRPLSLYCVSGEFANETVVVPEDGVSIGRDPARVNLVLEASEISGAHARVRPEPKSAQVWLEDLHSLNGTFYRQRSERKEEPWTKLEGKILLLPGARFRLAEDGPEFEIRRS